MSKEGQSKRKRAFAIFKEHHGSIDMIEIARLLEAPPGTVRGWKSKDNWEGKLNGTERAKKRSVPENGAERSKKRGAPKGNKNALNNAGGAPKGNKNARKTGEYESIYSDLLSEEERELLNDEVNTSLILAQEINLLRVRQLRMMKRLKKAEAGLDDKEKNILYELRGRKTLVEARGKKIPVEVDAELTQTEIQEKSYRKIDDVLRIEEALTRVSKQLTQTLKQYEELTLMRVRVELTKAQADKTNLENASIKKTTNNSEESVVFVSSEEEMRRYMEENADEYSSTHQ